MPALPLLVAVLSLALLAGCASTPATEVQQGPPSCDDWRDYWTKAEGGVYWLSPQWQELSHEESLALAEPIFEQTDDEIKVVFAAGHNHPLLQSSIPESQRYYIDIAKKIPLPDITGNGHCDVAVQLEPLRTDLDKDDNRLLCNDSTPSLCVFHPTPRVSFEHYQNPDWRFHRLHRQPLLYEGRSDQPPRLVGEIGSFLDEGSEQISSGFLTTGRLRDLGDGEYILQAYSGSTVLGIRYNPQGLISERIRTRAGRDSSSQEIHRPIHFSVYEEIIKETLYFDNVDPWSTPDSPVTVLELTLRFDRDKRLFVDSLLLKSYGPNEEDGRRPTLELSSEYERLDLQPGDQIILLNDKSLEEVFRSSGIDLGAAPLDRETLSHAIFATFSLMGRYLQGEKPQTVCSGHQCETYGEDRPASPLQITVKRGEAPEHRVTIRPPSSLVDDQSPEQ